MPITAGQRLIRKAFIGGSDIAVLTGHDRYRSPVNVWKSKTEEATEDKESHSMLIGNILEPAVLKYAEHYLESPVMPHETIIVGRAGVNLDGYCEAGWKYRNKAVERPCVVEAKTTGFNGPPLDDWSGRALTDNVPARVLIQCQYQLALFNEYHPGGADIAWVCLLSGHDAKGFRMFKINYSESLGKRLVRIANHFWEKWVAPKIEPPQAINWLEELP